MQIKLNQDSDYGKADEVITVDEAQAWQVLAAGLGERLNASDLHPETAPPKKSAAKKKE